jgi:hypothetical protein
MLDLCRHQSQAAAVNLVNGRQLTNVGDLRLCWGCSWRQQKQIANRQAEVNRVATIWVAGHKMKKLYESSLTVKTSNIFRFFSPRKNNTSHNLALFPSITLLPTGKKTADMISSIASQMHFQYKITIALGKCSMFSGCHVKTSAGSKCERYGPWTTWLTRAPPDTNPKNC